MREIKFRAWDEVDKKFVFEGFSIVGETTLFGLLHQYPYELNRIINWEIQQFTGLKDKNSKEIYEGDIINGRYGISVVRFIDCGFHPLCGEINSEKDPDIIEVIGNIYENPDLLK